MVTEVSVFGSAGVLSIATVSVGQASLPRISSVVPLQVIEQNPMLKTMPKCNLCSHLCIHKDNYQFK